MHKSLSFLSGLAVASTLLLSSYAVAQSNQAPMNMGYPPPPAMVTPQGGHYPAPQMSQQMMQHMMARQKQKMLDMQEQQKAQAEARQQAMAEEANQNKSSVKGEHCKHHGKKAAMHERMAQRDAHMQRMENSLANIEKLMQEMINLMKSKY